MKSSVRFSLSVCRGVPLSPTDVRQSNPGSILFIKAGPVAHLSGSKHTSKINTRTRFFRCYDFVVVVARLAQFQLAMVAVRQPLL